MPQFFSHPWLNENAIEWREYQEKILQTAVRSNTLAVLPTGTGKTPLAALVAAHRFERFPNQKVLMVAPTRPLAKQHRDRFEKFLKIGPDELRVVTGEIDPKDRAEEYRKSWIVFATPQTIERDIKRGILRLNSFSMLIVDEAHRSIGNYAYTNIASRYVQEATNPLILGLTASPGADESKIKQICKNLSIQAVEVRTEKDEDVKPYVQGTKMHWVKVELPEEFQRIQELLKNALDRRLRFLIKFGHVGHLKASKRALLELSQKLRRKAIEDKDPMLFQAFSVATQAIKIQHALELIQSQGLAQFAAYVERMVKGPRSKALRSIVGDEAIRDAIQLMASLTKKGLEHPKYASLKQILEARLEGEKKAIVFTQYVDSVDEIVRFINGTNARTCPRIPRFAQDARTCPRIPRFAQDARTCPRIPRFAQDARTTPPHLASQDVPNIRAEKFVGQRKGVTQKRQLEILKDFRDGLFNVLVATSIGEEGLDIPDVDVVIFYEPIPSEIRSIQRRGRTGRFRPGEIFILMTKNTIDEGYYWAAHHKEKRMRAILYDMQGETRGAQRTLTEVLGQSDAA